MVVPGLVLNSHKASFRAFIKYKINMDLKYALTALGTLVSGRFADSQGFTTSYTIGGEMEKKETFLKEDTRQKEAQQYLCSKHCCQK